MSQKGFCHVSSVVGRYHPISTASARGVNVLMICGSISGPSAHQSLWGASKAHHWLRTLEVELTLLESAFASRFHTLKREHMWSQKN